MTDATFIGRRSPLDHTDRDRRFHRGAFRLVLALVAIAVAANVALGIAFALAHNASSVVVARQESSPRLVAVVPVDAQTLVAATIDNHVIVLREGETAGAVEFSAPIGGLARDPRDGRIGVGLGDGRLALLSAQLQPVGEVPLPSRVVAVAATSGGFAAAYGGGVAGQASVAVYAPSAIAPVWTQAVEFTVTELASDSSGVIFATGNGRVGSLNAADGSPGWVSVVTRPATSLALAPDLAGILIGDDRGNVTLLDRASGEPRWVTNVASYPIRSVGFVPGQATVLAGDAEGHLVALDAEGRRRFSADGAEGAIEAFVPDGSGDRVIAIPREGAWLTVVPSAITDAALAGRLRLAWLVVDGVLSGFIAGAAVAAVPRWRVAARRFGVRLRRSRTAYLFLFPACTLVGVFGYYPLGMAVWYSLTDASSRNVTEFVGLRNYVEILTDDFYFRTGLANLGLILATDVLKVLSVPLLTAELIFWLRNRVHRYIFRTLIVGSAVVPGLVTTLLWRLIYAPNVGLIDASLAAIGLGGWQRAWLGDDGTAIWAIIGTGFPFLSAFAFLIYLGGLLDINPELHDAAALDGANQFHRFYHVDVPLLVPQFRLLLFFAFLGSLQGFAGIYILTRGGPGYSTYVPALEMYLRLTEQGDFGYASAIGVLLLVVVFLATLPLLRFRREADLVRA